MLCAKQARLDSTYGNGYGIVSWAKLGEKAVRSENGERSQTRLVADVHVRVDPSLRVVAVTAR
jgi:hypothetical protein